MLRKLHRMPRAAVASACCQRSLLDPPRGWTISPTRAWVQVVRLNQDRWGDAHALWRRGVAVAPQHGLLAAQSAKEAAYANGGGAEHTARTFVLHDDFHVLRAPRAAGVRRAVSPLLTTLHTFHGQPLLWWC